MPTPRELLRLVTIRQRQRSVRLMLWMVLALVAMIAAYSIAFHYLMALEGRSFSWPSGLYWALTTMTTLGYGDITFESDIGMLFSVFVLVSGVLLFLMLLPFCIIQFIFAPWLNQREAARTPRRVRDDLTGHLVLTRMDAVTQTVIARARRANIPHVVIVEDAKHAGSLQDEGYQVMVGPLDSPRTYRNAGIDRAVMLATTQPDTTNTNITFTVRQLASDIRVVATADRKASVDVLSLAGADHVIQLGSTLGTAMASRVLGTTGRTRIVGNFGQTRIAEAGVRGTSLVALTVEQARLEMSCGVRLLALVERGNLQVPHPHTVIDEHTTLILAGTLEELEQYDERFAVACEDESPVLILGGGRVGRAAAEEFINRGVPYTIIERLPERIPSHLNVVHGDAAELDNLQAAGLGNASTVLVTTHEDDMNVYLTLYCRRLQPDIQIVARATHERNVSTLYRAGADGVLSYATIGAITIWNDLHAGHRIVIAEGVELFLVPVPSTLAGHAFHDTNVRAQTGCHIVAITDNDAVILDDTETIPADPTAKLMIMADRHAERQFREHYLKKYP